MKKCADLVHVCLNSTFRQNVIVNLTSLCYTIIYDIYEERFTSHHSAAMI